MDVVNSSSEVETSGECDLREECIRLQQLLDGKEREDVEEQRLNAVLHQHYEEAEKSFISVRDKLLKEVREEGRRKGRTIWQDRREEDLYLVKELQRQAIQARGLQLDAENTKDERGGLERKQ